MMIVHSKQYTKAYHELESKLKCLIHNFAYDRGLNCYFIEDSKIIQTGIGNISTRIANLLEETRLVKYQMRDKKALEKAIAKKKGVKK